MATPKLPDSSKKLSLTFVIDDFRNLSSYKYSSRQTHFDCEWYMEAYRYNEWWTIAMKFNKGNNSKKFHPRWRHCVEASLYFLSPTETFICSKGSSENPLKLVATADPTWILYHQSKFQDTVNSKMVGNSVTVRCDWNVREVIIPSNVNFSTPTDSLITDSVIVVQERKFHVSKAVLASFSTYFRTMFYEKFSESEESEVTLKDVDPEDFQDLLEVIYHKTDVTIENARELLELVNYFDVKDVRNKCERVIVSCPLTTIQLKEKLYLADKYVLPELLEHCMQNMTSVEQIQTVTPQKVTAFNPSTIEQLLQKVIDLRKQ